MREHHSFAACFAVRQKQHASVKVDLSPLQPENFAQSTAGKRRSRIAAVAAGDTFTRLFSGLGACFFAVAFVSSNRPGIPVVSASRKASPRRASSSAVRNRSRLSSRYFLMPFAGLRPSGISPMPQPRKQSREQRQNTIGSCRGPCAEYFDGIGRPPLGSSHVLVWFRIRAGCGFGNMLRTTSGTRFPRRSDFSSHVPINKFTNRRCAT